MTRSTHRSAFAIVAKENDVLLTRRKDVPIWVLPGGGIDTGETPEEAARREILEETGITAKIVRLAGRYTPINRLSYETYVYECEAESGTPTLSEETSQIGYFFVENLPEDLFPLHRDWIDDWKYSCGSTVFKPLTQVTYRQLAKYILAHPLIFLKFLKTRIAVFFGRK